MSKGRKIPMGNRPGMGGLVAADKATQAQRPDWILAGRVRADSINMLEITAEPVNRRPIVVGQIPYVGNVHPAAFFERVGIIVQTSASVIAKTHGASVGIAQDVIQAETEEVVRAVSQYLKGALIDPRSGKKIVKTEPDGAILASQPDEIEVQGSDDQNGGRMLQMPTELEEEMMEAATPAPVQEDADEDEQEPASDAPTGPRKLILPD